MSRYTEIKGCIHIHFPLRILKKKIETLGKAGEKAGVDFIIINSHTPERKPEKYEQIFKKEGYYGKTLVIPAEETDDETKQNHLLVIGEKKWYGNKNSVEDVLIEINKTNNASFIAHPDGFHKLFLFKKEYFWNNWSTYGFTGMEVWSMLFDWAKYTRLYNLPVRYFGFPKNLRGPSKKVLSIWDNLALKKKVVGIAGLDIHQLPLFLYLIDVKRNFRYYKTFKYLRNHLLIKELLTGSPVEDKNKIINTLKHGSLFFANDLVADSSGFFFGTEDGEKTMGDTILNGTALFIKNPLKAKTRIISSGKIIYEEEIVSKKFMPEIPGIYRIEVEINGQPWIFSNHIRVVE